MQEDDSSGALSFVHHVGFGNHDPAHAGPSHRRPAHPCSRSERRCVVFQTAQDKVMSGAGAPFYSFPYLKGVTTDEARNLAFISAGLCGKPLLLQKRRGLRLARSPKSGKAFVKGTLANERSSPFRRCISPREYGPGANANPAEPRQRWRRRPRGSDERVPTRLFSGYAELVAALYTDRRNKKLCM